MADYVVETYLSRVRVRDLEGAAARARAAARELAEAGVPVSHRPSQDVFVASLCGGGPVRFDLFVLDLATGKTAQVMSKKNANLESINNPTWSPDGAYLAFHSSGLSIDGRMDIYKIRSDGSGKAVNLGLRTRGASRARSGGDRSSKQRFERRGCDEAVSGGGVGRRKRRPCS